jgi:hypothetical protein
MEIVVPMARVGVIEARRKLILEREEKRSIVNSDLGICWDK